MTFMFLFISYAVIGVIILFMPKRLTLQEGYITWITVSFITLLSDLVLGHLLDLYDLLKPGPELTDLFIEITLPGAFGILYMNFMQTEKRKFIYYLIFWVFISVGYEQLARYFGYVHYKGWKVWHSFIFYFFSCLYMSWHYWFIRKVIVEKNRD